MPSPGPCSPRCGSARPAPPKSHAVRAQGGERSGRWSCLPPSGASEWEYAQPGSSARVGAHRFAAPRALPSPVRTLAHEPRRENMPNREPHRRIGAHRFAAARALPSSPRTLRRARVRGAPAARATYLHLALARVASSSLPHHGWGTFAEFSGKSLSARSPGLLAQEQSPLA